jgi:hypothetical protein
MNLIKIIFIYSKPSPHMKLRSILLVTVFAIFGLVFVVYVGFLVFPYLNLGNEGSNINYIAPYINNTHSCSKHSLGCTAELPNQMINYTVWSTDGTINITSYATIGDNGFFKLNLEINKNYVIQMQTISNNTPYEGTTNFSTAVGSANCITTGQLKP